MRIGYIRLGKAGPSLEMQQAALRTAGLTDFSAGGPVYVDQPPKRSPRNQPPATPKRTAMIRVLREGDEVVVMSAGRFGVSLNDTLEALAALTARGAALFEVETQRAYRWHPEAAEVVELAVRSESQRRREQLKRMRERLAEMNIERGPATQLSAKKLKELKADWSSVVLTAAEVAEKYGIPNRTLYNMLGPRGTPRFGGPGPHKRKGS